MFANKTFYNKGDKTETDRFFIETIPELTDPRVDKELSGWGDTFTFQVNFTDEDGDTNIVKLWRRLSGTSDWGINPIAQNTSASGVNQTVTLTYSGFTCGDLNNNENET